MKQLTSITEWPLAAPEGAVFSDQNRWLTKADVLKRATYWWHHAVVNEGELWGVYHSDILEFVAILFALWQKGATACVMGDSLPATQTRLESQVHGFIGEFVEYPHVLSFNDVELAAVDWRVLSPNFEAMTIYTSGSTGEPKSIIKTLSNIDEEIRSLERIWPDETDCVVVSTVSHLHLYGLTFRLFRPLVRGQVIERQICHFTEDIFNRARRYKRFSLVSTPAHLARLDQQSLPSDESKLCHHVLSSAAPLKRNDSLKVQQIFGAPVREIFGSSETGAIAWRIQSSQEENLWQPLPGVRFAEQQAGEYVVSASHISEPQQLSDFLSFDATGHFALFARKDGVVKIEGKRLSLAEMQKVIENHPLVTFSKALVLQRKRSEVALVIELTLDGKEKLKSIGKRGLQSEFRKLLSESFETVVLPRKWKFVDQMPFNTQGKLPLKTLTAMFDQERVVMPEVVSEKFEAHRLTLSIRIPERLVYFDGHFEGNPILPGIVQVHWVEFYARKRLELTARFKQLEAVKFQQVIFPDTEVTLVLEYNADKQKLSFRYFSEKGVHSSGRICFG